MYGCKIERTAKRSEFKMKHQVAQKESHAAV